MKSRLRYLHWGRVVRPLNSFSLHPRFLGPTRSIYGRPATRSALHNIRSTVPSDRLIRRYGEVARQQTLERMSVLFAPAVHNLLCTTCALFSGSISRHNSCVAVLILHRWKIHSEPCTVNEESIIDVWATSLVCVTCISICRSHWGASFLSNTSTTSALSRLSSPESRQIGSPLLHVSCIRSPAQSLRCLTMPRGNRPRVCAWSASRTS
ncbi:hypothetical protein C8R47DRAFT_289545 [Mycena vitilis]|nr:hypothetical protein C8R47DRAFT_289545 [Mycena vitilis]